MLIDSHAHIHYDDKLDFKKIIKNMKDDGLYAIIDIGTDEVSSECAVINAEQNENVYAIVGIHPDSVSDEVQSRIAKIEKIAKSDKVVAIGEIGLDYHFVQDNKEKQKELFEKQIELAIKLDLPICIHSRDSSKDTIEILEKYNKALKRKGVMHCYSNGGEDIQKYLDLGFYISFAGNVTFKKYDREFLKLIPKDKILVETDCPFLAPEPLRGQINEPKNVNITAQFLADFYEMSYDEFSLQTLNNTKTVYFKIK